MKTKQQQLKDEITHLRKAAKASADSYIGRMTRRYLNCKANEMEKELKRTNQNQTNRTNRLAVNVAGQSDVIIMVGNINADVIGRIDNVAV